MYFTAISILTTNLLLLPAQVRAACYYLDGTLAPDDLYQPCNPEAEISPCCAGSEGVMNDICMSSGLCYSQQGTHKGFIYSNGCTDSTGLSSECPHFCPDATTGWGGGPKVMKWNVLQCSVGVYCCRESEDPVNCCSNTSAVITTDIGTLLVSTTATSSIIGPTLTITSSVTAATPTLPGENKTAAVATCPKDHTVVIGSAVGGVLGAALLATLGALAFMVKRRKGWMPSPVTPAYARSGYHADDHHSKGLQFPGAPYYSPQELSAMAVHEMHS